MWVTLSLRVTAGDIFVQRNFCGFTAAVSDTHKDRIPILPSQIQSSIFRLLVQEKKKEAPLVSV